MRRMRKLCTLCPHIGDAKELEVVDAMDTEDHGESVHEFNMLGNMNPRYFETFNMLHWRKVKEICV